MLDQVRPIYILPVNILYKESMLDQVRPIYILSVNILYKEPPSVDVGSG